MQTGKAQGMMLMNEALVELVVQRVIEPQEAYLKAIDKPGLLSALKSKGVPVHAVDGPRTLQPA
jgi:twitching motility protein PilT